MERKISKFSSKKAFLDWPTFSPVITTLQSMNNLAETLRTMGEHQGAKALQENLLERIKEILGLDHPATTVAAWNYFLTLHNIEDYETAKRIITENLLWLLDESVILHDAYQIQIREMLKRILGVNKSNEDEFVSDT